MKKVHGQLLLGIWWLYRPGYQAQGDMANDTMNNECGLVTGGNILYLTFEV